MTRAVCASWVVVVTVTSGTIAGCDADDAISAEQRETAVAGTYELSEWHFVANGDTLEMTDDSYLRIRLSGSDRADGEGLIFVWMLAPAEVDEIERYARVPVLGIRVGANEIDPLTLRGWYYVEDGGSAGYLRFSFRHGQGGGTWLEDLDWKLASDGRSYAFEYDDGVEVLRIVLTRR